VIKTDTQNASFKPSPIGSIPIDWEVKRLGDICKIFGRIGYRGYTVNDIVEKGDGAITLSPSNFNDGYLDYSDCTYISWFKYDESPEIKITDDDLLLVKTGSTYGKTALVDNLVQKATINPQIVVIKNVKSDVKYLSYIISDSIIQKQIKKAVVGGAIPTLSQENILNFTLPIPSIPEQKAIAHVLGLMDSAVNANNQLIAKKELQKKWLMQNLLTGKKRIKGFNLEWKEVQIKSVFQFLKSYSISREGLTKSYKENPIYCIHYGDIHALYETDFLDFSTQQSIPQIIDEAHTLYEKDYLKEGDVIMADASEDYEGVGEAIVVLNLEKRTAVGGLHTIVLRDYSGETEAIFRGYLFASESVKNKLRTKATGTSVYSVTKSTLESITILLPPVKEQKAIAQVLQAADKEIQLLKTKTEQLREQKKGLRQVLLTGKKRIVLNNEDLKTNKK
jgi:type I restriction enzyme S subunit